MKLKNGIMSVWFGIIQQLLTLAFGLVVPRLFIQTFGSEINGMLSSLSNLYSYLSLVEAGVGTVAIQALYGPIGRDDKKDINAIMAATANYYNKAGLMYLIGVIAISVIYPLTVNTSLPFSMVFSVSMLNGAGGVINFWVFGKYLVLFQAEGKKYLMSIVTMVTYVVSNLMKIVLLINGFDVVAIHVGYFIINIGQMLFYFYYIKSRYKWLNLKVKQNKKALSQSNAVFVQQIMWMICNNTDIFVLTYVAGDLKAVSVYTVYLMIYSTIEKLFSTFFGSFHYLLGQKYNNDRDNYMFLHKIYENLSMTGSFILYTIAFLLTTPFMKIYTAGITDVAYVDAYLPFLFAFMHLLSSSREASSRVINFAGHFKQMQWRAILESVINIVASVILVLWFGIYGVLLGTIIAYLYRTNDIIIYANRHILKRSCWHTYKIWLKNIAVFVIIFVISLFVDLTSGNFGILILKAIPCGIIVCLAYFAELAIFDRESGKHLISMVFKPFSKFKKSKNN